MPLQQTVSAGQQNRALGLSTFAFTICFAVWTIFAIIGIQIKQDLGLNDTQFGLLVGTPILTGSLVRLFLGVWTDQYGGRIVFPLTMLASALSTYLLTFADTYLMMLVAALGLGRLCLQVVPAGKAGLGAGLFRDGQCRRGSDQVRRAVDHGGDGLAGSRADLGFGPGADRRAFLCLCQGRSRSRRAQDQR
jgi:MFS family permease